MLAICAIALAVAACGGDDNTGGANGQPTATEEPDDGRSPAPSNDDGGTSPAPGAETGMIVIGGETFEFVVEICSIEDDGQAIAYGTGLTSDGEPFTADISLDPGGVVAYASVDVNDDPADLFDIPTAQWQGSKPAVDATIDTTGPLHISFTDVFSDLQASEFLEIDGSADVTCDAS